MAARGGAQWALAARERSPAIGARASSDEKASSADGELAKPPSVLWLVIPLMLILVYAALR